MILTKPYPKNIHALQDTIYENEITPVKQIK